MWAENGKLAHYMRSLELDGTTASIGEPIFVGDPPLSDATFLPDATTKKYDDVLDVITLSDEPIVFTLYRGKDSSGVSGTGKVLEGIIFTDLTVAVHWCTDNAPASTTIYDNADHTTGWWKFVNIHVQPHPFNETRIEFKKAGTKDSGIDAYWEQKADPGAVFQKQIQEHYGHVVIDADCDLCKKAVYPPLSTPVPTPSVAPWLYCAVCNSWYYAASQHLCLGNPITFPYPYVPYSNPYPNPNTIWCNGRQCNLTH